MQDYGLGRIAGFAGGAVIWERDMNIREEFGKGRVRVCAEFDGVPYEGSIVNMGVKDAEGNVSYIIGMRKDIRRQLNKGAGDTVHILLILLSEGKD